MWVYAISSRDKNYIYVGLTQDIAARLKRHNRGWERTTKFYCPFELIYKEYHPDRASARIAEKYWNQELEKKNSDS